MNEFTPIELKILDNLDTVELYLTKALKALEVLQDIRCRTADYHGYIGERVADCYKLVDAIVDNDF